MTWQELTEARHKLGLTEKQMAAMLRVSLSTYKSWGQRGKVPGYIAASVEAHVLLSDEALKMLLSTRVI